MVLYRKFIFLIVGMFFISSFTSADISISTGEPKIISISNVEFEEGSFDNVEVGVQNYGNSVGGFVVRIVNCSDGISASSSPYGVTLESGESEILSFKIVGSTLGSTVNGFCVIEMKESASQEIDSLQFPVVVYPMNQEDITPDIQNKNNNETSIKKNSSSDFFIFFAIILLVILILVVAKRKR